MSAKGAVLSEAFKSTPYWWEDAPPEDASSQPLPEEAEIAIVGSGYTGLCCALELAENGAKPVVIEAGPLGAGASTRSGAMVTGGQKLVVSGAIGGLDAERQARILEDAGELLALMGERVVKYRLDADYFRYGRVILAHVPRHTKRLEQWAKLLSEHAGSTVSVLGRPELASEVGGKRYHGGLLIEDYGGLHPAKYHRALREAGATAAPSWSRMLKSSISLMRGRPFGCARSEARCGRVRSWSAQTAIPIGSCHIFIEGSCQSLPMWRRLSLCPRAWQKP